MQIAFVAAATNLVSCAVDSVKKSSESFEDVLADLVQMNGLGLSFQAFTQPRMSDSCAGRCDGHRAGADLR
jgi:hypothetical protein